MFNNQFSGSRLIIKQDFLLSLPMSLFVSSLNSGSNGNCFYIGNEKEAILVDAGISCREIEKRMKRLELPMKKVRAVFVTHEHSDHIKGISVLSKKYQLPVYITRLTQQSGRIWLERHLSIPFTGFEPVQIGSLSVTAVPKYHDAADPYSFIVSCNDVRVGIFTDTGTPCDNLVKNFVQCHAAFLEANYDEDMLENGSYPYHLKKRIRGGSGHLSNSQALHLFKKHRPSFMSHLFLSHLSKNNNCPDLVTSLFNRHAGNTKIIVASRYQETPVFQIRNTSQPETVRVAQLQFAF
jgi:phosphoribosyl 1,2-cyclic phosphodiesterase